MASMTTVMTIAGGVAAAVVKVAKVARVARVAKALESRARDPENLARDLLEADLGGAQRLVMMIGAIGVTAAAVAAAAAAAAPASLARDEEPKKYEMHATCVLIRCTVMM